MARARYRRWPPWSVTPACRSGRYARAWTGWKPSYVLPGPDKVFPALWDDRSVVWSGALTTLRRAVEFYVIAVVIGTVVAVAISRSRVVRSAVSPLIAGLQTSFSDEREQVVYEMAMALANSRWVPQGLYDRAVKALGHVGITDVITLMGYYTSVSMTLAFYDVPAGASGLAR